MFVIVKTKCDLNCQFISYNNLMKQKKIIVTIISFVFIIFMFDSIYASNNIVPVKCNYQDNTLFNQLKECFTLFNFVKTICISIICSFLFFVIINYVFRPNFKISNKITKNFDGDNVFYTFKIINKSCLFYMYDVTCDLSLALPVGADGGFNLKLQDIKLCDSKMGYIPRLKLNSKKGFASYAVRFRTEVDLLEIWKDDASFLTLRVIAKHGVTGLPKIKTQPFHQKEDIIFGKFKRGNTFDII